VAFFGDIESFIKLVGIIFFFFFSFSCFKKYREIFTNLQIYKRGMNIYQETREKKKNKR